MKSILIIHQSAELYGSDKTILMFLSALDKTRFRPVVVLPFTGPLHQELTKNGIAVHIAPVLKLYRKMFTPSGLMKFAGEYVDGLKALKELHREYQFSLVYSHTLASLIGYFFAKKNRIKHLWHVQEIIAQPRMVNRIFTWLLRSKPNHVAVYDSHETMKFWADADAELKQKSIAIWNGLDTDKIPRYEPAEIANVRLEILGAQPDEIVIGLIGRINSWKGQPLLVDAFSKLAPKYSQIKLVFLGSPPPNQDGFLSDLVQQISDLNLGGRVKIIPFQQEIWKFWNAIDIAVVPSTEPEPFGMVAIEAMSASKPVVAANHGGLTEIVVHGETGFLFEPRNPDALAQVLEPLITDAELRSSMGEKGQHRAATVFSLEHHTREFEQIFDRLIK